MPVLIELHPDGSEMRRFPLLPPVTELGADPAAAGPGGVPGAHCLQLGPAPYLCLRHCILAYTDGGIVTITPASREAETFINNQRIIEPTIVQVNE
jgi:afadin